MRSLLSDWTNKEVMVRGPTQAASCPTIAIASPSRPCHPKSPSTPVPLPRSGVDLGMALSASFQASFPHSILPSSNTLSLEVRGTMVLWNVGTVAVAMGRGAGICVGGGFGAVLLSDNSTLRCELKP